MFCAFCSRSTPGSQRARRRLDCVFPTDPPQARRRSDKGRRRVKSARRRAGATGRAVLAGRGATKERRALPASPRAPAPTGHPQAKGRGADWTDERGATSPPREPKGAGADWTDERGARREGGALKGAQRRVGQHSSYCWFCSFCAAPAIFSGTPERCYTSETPSEAGTTARKA
jgi:hypothetical protein